MGKRQAGGVEELALQLEISLDAVDGVTGDRKVDGREVHADLMRPPRLEGDGEQRVSGINSTTLKLVTASRGLFVSSEIRVGSLRSRPIAASIRPRFDRGRPRTSARYSRTSSRRLSRALEPAVRLVGAGDDEEPRRVPVEAVDDSRPLRLLSTRHARPRRPWTSVPRVWPAEGWTTMPAGLSTTSRCSSSYATRMSSSSGSRLDGRRSGTRNLEPLARHEPVALRTGRAVHEHPLLRQQTLGGRPRPDFVQAGEKAVQPFACRLGRHVELEVSQASSRRAARRSAPDPRLPLRGHEGEEQCGHADDDEGVGEVERRPEAKVEEVRDVTDAEAVDEVPEASADQESERDRQDRMPRARLGEVEEHPQDRRRRQERDRRGPAREESERDPRVVDVPDPEGPDDVDRLPEPELRDDDLLRQLVSGERRERDREQAEPVEWTS